MVDGELYVIIRGYFRKGNSKFVYFVGRNDSFEREIVGTVNN